MTPDAARRYGLAARRALPVPERQAASRRLCVRLAATPWFRDAQCIAVYVAQYDEPQLEALIALAREHGKRHHEFLSRARDLVCAPVTAFDAQLRRVGMGGGYYDRWFSQRLHRYGVRRIGIAFDCQRVEDIEAQSWDVSLHGVVTETHVYKGL